MTTETWDNTSNAKVQQYFRHRQEIMLSQKKMFTSLVDKKQNYTKGILCEEVVRVALREFLPSKIAVAQGFVDTGKEGETKQCDILIYDRSQYAPLLEVNDLVILPVDAVLTVIEVKSKLDKRRVESALENVLAVDTLELLRVARARKYIVAFDSPKLETIAKYEMFSNDVRDRVDGLCVFNKGFLYLNNDSMSKQYGGKFEMYLREDALFVLVFLIMKDIYFRTGLMGATPNPYEDYIHSIQSSMIV